MALLLGALGRAAHGAEIQWSVKPSYASPSTSTKLVIRDDQGDVHELYDQSTAVLIIEGAYRGVGGWRDVSEAAQVSEVHLRDAFLKRGFKVLIWRDLDGPDLKKVLDEIGTNLGYEPNARLILYYFGHGTVVGTPSDDAGERGFLVPVGTADQVTNEQEFYRTAIPLGRLESLVKDMTTKHVFVALEACHAGSLFDAHLGEVSKPNPQGYLLGDALQKPVRQFLTAGDARQDVPANSLFTGVFEDGLDKADTNGDGYVTGTELMAYVALTIPQRTPTNSLSPETGYSGKGDIILGPVNGEPRSVARGTPGGAPRLVEVRPQISGTLVSLSVKPGSMVRRGQRLFQLDPRVPQLALREANAKLASDQAQLALNQKSHDEIEVKVTSGNRPKSDLDTANLLVNRANADVQRDAVSIDRAKLELVAATGSAQVCGRVLSIFVSPGSHVDPGSPVLSISVTGCEVDHSSPSSTEGFSRTPVPAPPTAPTKESGQRSLSIDQQRYLVEKLYALKSQLPSSLLLYHPNDNESYFYSSDFQKVFSRAGLQPNWTQANPIGPYETGVMIEIEKDTPRDVATQVQSILSDIGISATIVERPDQHYSSKLILFIGPQPL